MAIVALKVKSKNKDYSYQPFVSILVPTYNEEKVIQRRIGNLLELDYPKDKYEIIVVDSGSIDSTTEIVERLIEKQGISEPIFRLVKEEQRKGKASAINFGRTHAKGEIILVADADNLFSNNVLSEIAPYFKDPEVGAVGGRFVLTNTQNELVRSSSFYWNLESLMRQGESSLDSACLTYGGLNACRKELVEPDTNSISDDLDMAIQIRKQGYKIAYAPDALAYEAGPTTAREQIVQKKRTTIGTIESFFKHKRYLWLPHDKYSGFIFPSHKTLQIFSPYLLIGALAMFIALLALGRFNFVVIFTLATATVFSILLAILRRKLAKFNLVNNHPVSKAVPFSSLFSLLYYVLLHEYIILLAWRDFILKRYTVLWQKVERLERQ